LISKPLIHGWLFSFEPEFTTLLAQETAEI
jgi:hypothetical protein